MMVSHVINGTGLLMIKSLALLLVVRVFGNNDISQMNTLNEIVVTQTILLDFLKKINTSTKQ